MTRALLLALALVLAACPAQRRVSPIGGGGPGGGGAGDGATGGGEGGGGDDEGDEDSDGAALDDLLVGEPEESERVKEVASKSSPSKGAGKKPRPKPPARKPVEVAERDRIAAVDRTAAQRQAAVAPLIARARGKLVSADLDGAIRDGHAALEIDSGEPTAIAILAEAYYRKGWLRKAQHILEVATGRKGGGKRAELWMLRGLVAEAAGAPLAEVRTAYETATQLKPDYARAWNNLGVVYLRLQENVRAVGAFANATTNDPDSVAAVTNLGTAYRRQAGESTSASQRAELLRKAERAYRTAIALDEEYAPAYLNLGVLYMDFAGGFGMTDIERLKAAIGYLRNFKRRGVAAVAEDGKVIDVDGYLDAARKQLAAVELLQTRKP